MERSAKSNSESSLDSVQLVASMLLCYPEISKVTLDSEAKALIIEFAMRETPDDDVFDTSETLIIDSLKLYHSIEYIKGAKFAFYYENCALHIYRDLASFSRGELGILVQLVKEKFSKYIIIDENRNADEDMLYTQAEMIDHRIRFLKESSFKETMVGVREDGKVMVFDR